MAEVEASERAACVPAAIVNTSVAEPVPALLVALMVVLTVPAAVGVPVIWPFEVSTLRPAGSPVAL